MTTVEEHPRYPECEVELIGTDGNAFGIVGTVSKHLRRHLAHLGRPAHTITAEVNAFQREATSGNYEHLLATCDRWVTVL